MPFTKKSLISIRMDEKLLKSIDSYCSDRRYLSRSAFIERILSAVVNCANDNTLHNMLKVWDPYSAGYEVRFLRPVKPIPPKN